MMMMQVVLAVESIEHSRQLLHDGQLREAFLVSRQARDASGLYAFIKHHVCRFQLIPFELFIRTAITADVRMC